MSTEQRTCIVVICDGCKQPYQGYEDDYIVHWDSVEEFAEQNEEYKSEHNYWIIEGEQHFCRDCWCKRAGHPYDPEATFAGVDGVVRRYCQCGKRWPVEESKSSIGGPP